MDIGYFQFGGIINGAAMEHFCIYLLINTYTHFYWVKLVGHFVKQFSKVDETVYISVNNTPDSSCCKSVVG